MSSPQQTGTHPSELRRAAHRLLGPGAIVGTSVAVEFGSQFLRTVLLARLLTPTEFGLAVSINAYVAILEMSTSFGPGRYLVYARDGAETKSLAALHLVTLVRGVAIALLLIGLAAPVASMLGQGEHASSFAIVAIVPLLRGASHYGVYQAQRSERFLPFALAEGGGAIAGLLAAGLAALLHPDHHAILWGLAAQMLWLFGATHLLSPEPYRVSIDPDRVWRITRFGLPLTINGTALAVASQLDRMVVGAALGVVALGIYGLTITLVLQPVSLLLKLASTVLQPRLSESWHAKQLAYQQLVHRVAAGTGVVGLAAAGVAVCIAEPLFVLTFGQRYAVGGISFVLLAFVGLLRFARGNLGVLGVASGRTKDLMLANLLGSAGLCVTVAALAWHPAIESALVGLLAGELLSFARIAYVLDGVPGTRERPILRAVLLASVLPAALSAWVLTSAPSLPLRITAAALVFLLALGLAPRAFGAWAKGPAISA